MEDAIITAAMCINNEYELAFLEAWNFALHKKEASDSGLLGTRIFSDIGDIRVLLKKVLWGCSQCTWRKRPYESSEGNKI